ncbi:hypothetical protein H8959_010900, partial [Pygathrix nigripes]
MVFPLTVLSVGHQDAFPHTIVIVMSRTKGRGVSHDCCPMCVRGVLWESMDSEVPDGSAVCRGSMGCVVFIAAGRWTMDGSLRSQSLDPRTVQGSPKTMELVTWDLGLLIFLAM